jgi:hypothetical protein
MVVVEPKPQLLEEDGRDYKRVNYLIRRGSLHKREDNQGRGSKLT